MELRMSRLLAGIASLLLLVGPAMATTQQPVVGSRLNETLQLPGLDGLTHSLKEWRGHPIILNFWAPWCGPCQYEIRHLVKYQERYRDRGLRIVGVGLDKEPKLRNVQRTLGINYPVLVAPAYDPGRLLAKWGNPQGVVPYTVVLDASGKVAYTEQGTFNDDAFETFVLPMLKAAR